MLLDAAHIWLEYSEKLPQIQLSSPQLDVERVDLSFNSAAADAPYVRAIDRAKKSRRFRSEFPPRIVEILDVIVCEEKTVNEAALKLYGGANPKVSVALVKERLREALCQVATQQKLHGSWQPGRGKKDEGCEVVHLTGT